jgi:hypothetical protein
VTSFVSRSWWSGLALCLVVYGLGGGCGFLTLRKDLQKASKKPPERALVQGSVGDRATGGGPFVVVVYSPRRAA